MLIHAPTPHFDHALKVAHAFATNLTMHFSLIILSALEFHTFALAGAAFSYAVT
jgi:hypothetical protein